MLTDLCARMQTSCCNGPPPPSPIWILEDSEEMNLAEAPVRYRRGNKWKRRWAVLRRANPAADELSLVLYKDEDHAKKKQKQKAFVSLVDYCGLQLFNKLGKHFNIIVIITTSEVTRLSFQDIAGRCKFLDRLEEHFGQEKSFEGIVPHRQKIKSGEATLRFYGQSAFFCLSRKDNYKCIGRWKLVDLPKYGAVEEGFAFETIDSNSNDKKSMYFFSTSKGKEIHQLFDSVCRIGEPASLAAAASQETVLMRNKEGDNESSKSNFFQRAWYRMSGRKQPRKRHRPRSMSEPTLSGFRRRFSRSNDKKKTALESELSDSGEPVVLKKLSPTNEVNLPSETQVHVERKTLSSPTTPPGYEIMDAIPVAKKENNTAEYQNVDQIHALDKPISPKEELSNMGYELLRLMPSTNTGEIAGEEDQTVTEIVKEEEKVSVTQCIVTDQKETKTSEEVNTVKTRQGSDSQDKNQVKIHVKVKEQREKPDLKISVVVDEDKTRCNLDSKISQSSEELVAKESEVKKEKKLLNGLSDQNEMETGGKKQGPPVKERPRKAKSPPKEFQNNGNLRKSNDDLKSDFSEINKENVFDFKTNGARPPRGFKNPPPEIITPSDQNSYVNTDVIAYVNIPVKRRRCATSSVQSSSRTPGNSGDPYAIYDSNENDTIYHSVESLLPDSGRGINQNIRSSSFESISPTYQNLGTPSNARGQDASYVNMPVHGKKRGTQQHDQFGLNYVKLDTILSSSTPSVHSRSPPRASVSNSYNSNYTIIDQEKTELLKQTAQNRLKEQKEREKFNK